MSDRENTPQLTDSLVRLQPILESFPHPAVYVGGLPTDLLLAEYSSIVASDRVVNVSDLVDTPLYRANGTQRDIDIVCFTDDKDAIADLRDTLKNSLNNNTPNHIPVKISVSGYESAVNTSLCPQLVSQVSKREDIVDLSIGPISESIAQSVFEECWWLNYQSMPLPIHHPIGHMYNYRVRSLAGLRPKDASKVTRLENRLHTAFPEEEWARFNPYAKLESRIASELLPLEVFRHPSLQTLSMSIARIALKYFEANPTLTKLAQQETGLTHKMASFAVRASRQSFRG